MIPTAEEFRKEMALRGQIREESLKEENPDAVETQFQVLLDAIERELNIIRNTKGFLATEFRLAVNPAVAKAGVFNKLKAHLELDGWVLTLGSEYLIVSWSDTN